MLQATLTSVFNCAFAGVCLTTNTSQWRHITDNKVRVCNKCWLKHNRAQKHHYPAPPLASAPTQAPTPASPPRPAQSHPPAPAPAPYPASSPGKHFLPIGNTTCECMKSKPAHSLLCIQANTDCVVTAVRLPLVLMLVPRPLAVQLMLRWQRLRLALR